MPRLIKKDLVLSEFLWTDDRISLWIDAASHQKDLVPPKSLWTNAASRQKGLVLPKVLWVERRVSFKELSLT